MKFSWELSRVRIAMCPIVSETVSLNHQGWSSTEKKMAVFWDVFPHNVAETERCFRGACRLHHQWQTSVSFYQTTSRNIPEDSHLHNSLRENLKSHHPQYPKPWVTMSLSHSWIFVNFQNVTISGTLLPRPLHDKTDFYRETMLPFIMINSVLCFQFSYR
jgi:hypothetical protein